MNIPVENMYKAPVDIEVEEEIMESIEEEIEYPDTETVKVTMIEPAQKLK